MQDVLRRLRALDPDHRAAVLAQLTTRGEQFGVHPVSSGQRRLWLLDQVHPGHPVYSVPYAFRVRGHLDAEALGAALRMLGERHEALRTVFLDIGGEPRQVVLPDVSFGLVVTECPTAESRRDAVAAEQADIEARAPFDLGEGPLLRARLVRFAADDALLLVTLHHIVCDGWSTKVLFDELRRAYPALLDGVRPDLGAPPLQYVDYTRWQAEWSAGQARAGLVGYWTERLAGVPPVLEMPADRPRPAEMAMRGTVAGFAWPGSLDEFCRTERVTPFMVLLAVWNVLLYRYIGQDDLVVGTAVANRNRVELENAVGFYVNTLALRTRVDPHAGFRALLRQVHDTTLDAQAHQDLPFDAVVDALRLPRSTAHHPLFQTLVVMQDGERDIITLPGLDLQRVPSHMHTAKWDLQLAVGSTEGEISGWLEYDTALYDEDTVHRLLGHLRVLLDGALADPERPVGLLPMLTAAERTRVLREWNPPTEPHLGGRLVHELVEATADRTPDAVAMVHRDQRLTYAQLDERANRLAHHLRALGAERETLVGICLPRGLDQMVAMQGVLKSGAAYVPLDPEYPADRLAYMLHDSGVHQVITVADLAGRLPRDTPAILVDAGAEEIASRSADRPHRIGEPDDLAYVIYTSGSTGRPKGAMIPHRGVCNLADEQVRIVGTTPGDRVLQFASLSFDASVLEIMLGLHSGATVVLADRHDLQPGPDLARTIREQGVTTTFLPPTVLRLMDPADVPGLTTLTVGGEACPDEFAAAWAPGRHFRNIYGPTETTIWVASARGDGTDSPLPIGFPIDGLRCYVLDGNLEPVPPGVPGELCIGGAGVCRGYLGRPGLTAERFVPDPFSGRRGARLYRSGDLVRFRSDGAVEFLRRIDDQVKVRGYRIELGEVEAVLGRHESVRAAVVTTREDVPGDVRLVAYVVAGPGHTVDATVLRASLRRSLPEHMVPSEFVAVPTIPRTPNGKLDYRALPAPSSSAPPRTVIAEGTDLERTIVGVWREVLRVDHIGTDDNFFDLGGNSLLLSKARSRLAETLDREVAAVTLFTFPTVRALARHFEGDTNSAAGTGTGRDLATGRRALLAHSARRSGGDRR
ncbi:MAG: amino acid adenylation domain-containing protein [Actinophytocola sp.]|uniref:non-ribosomal peptide synthetase n=1 Tax=Actinophytocola sp. TaxID=1872138 RepID=UPI003C784A47